MTPFSSSINLLECLTEPRETVYLSDCQFMIRTQLRNRSWKRGIGQGLWEGPGAAVPSECPTLPKPPRAHQPQTLPKPHPFGFYGGCVRHDGHNHRLWGMVSTSSFSPLPREWEWWWVPLSVSSHPSESPRRHLININSLTQTPGEHSFRRYGCGAVAGTKDERPNPRTKLLSLLLSLGKFQGF